MLTNTSKIWKYFSNIFISIDQLGNVVAGGNPDNTISARVGYYNHHYPFEQGKVPWHWRWFEHIIDFTFYPVDGKGHCHEAYHHDAAEVFDNDVTNFLVGMAAAMIIIPSCICIALLLYFLRGMRLVRTRKISRISHLKRHLEKSIRLLHAAKLEAEEHPEENLSPWFPDCLTVLENSSLKLNMEIDRRATAKKKSF
ncbi:MAG: hypothetical protein OIF50_04690 [Flavobacteriaceae bacterium]|nr:hypothetical protein [Flavobacteriaceae bacterium]